MTEKLGDALEEMERAIKNYDSIKDKYLLDSFNHLKTLIVTRHDELTDDEVRILKNDMANTWSRLIPNSYSDATLNNIIDDLHGRGMIRRGR